MCKEKVGLFSKQKCVMYSRSCSCQSNWWATRWSCYSSVSIFALFLCYTLVAESAKDRNVEECLVTLSYLSWFFILHSFISVTFKPTFFLGGNCVMWWECLMLFCFTKREPNMFGSLQCIVVSKQLNFIHNFPWFVVDCHSYHFPHWLSLPSRSSNHRICHSWEESLENREIRKGAPVIGATDVVIPSVARGSTLVPRGSWPGATHRVDAVALPDTHLWSVRLAKTPARHWISYQVLINLCHLS